MRKYASDVSDDLRRHSVSRERATKEKGNAITSIIRTPAPTSTSIPPIVETTPSPIIERIYESLLLETLVVSLVIFRSSFVDPLVRGSFLRNCEWKRRSSGRDSREESGSGRRRKGSAWKETRGCLVCHRYSVESIHDGCVGLLCY